MSESIPPFNARGYLPPGIYETDFSEFEQRFGFNTSRQQLLSGLATALDSLRRAGCNRVYVGGSFVTDKVEPGDIDGCFEGLWIDEDAIEPMFLTADLDAQRAKYGVEFVLGGNRVGFFQTDRNGNLQGIVAINL